MTLFAALLGAALAAPHPESDEWFPPGQLQSSAGDLVLEHTDVVADVHVGLSVVTVTQTFANPFSDPVDATYLFPLPEHAAVRHLGIRCGSRYTEGVVMTRDDAQKEYDRAKSEGRRAALLEQYRPNLFKQQVAGLCPGEAVEIELEYVDELDYEDGTYELTFPMVVGPRYGSSESGRRAVTPRSALPAERPGNVSILVNVEEGLPLGSLYSDTHAITVEDEGTWGATVTLTDGETQANADFQLAWTLAGRSTRAAVVVDRQGTDDGYVALTLQPPPLDSLGEPPERELVFVLDSSCSMRGRPWRAAVATVEMALERMREGDTFNLVRFSSSASSLFDEPRPVTEANVEAARRWLGRFEGGGTDMIAGIEHALDMPGDADALRLVLLATDGYIGDEKLAFRTVARKLGDARVFALGVGSSVNRYLLEGLAEMGRGDVDYQLPGTPIPDTVASFYARIDHPAMTDIRVDWGGLDVTEVSPATVPDLWAGQPLRLVGRLGNAKRARVRVRGTVGGEEVVISVPVDATRAEAHEAVGTLWARRRIHDLSIDGEHQGPSAVEAAITATALEHHLVTDYTSLVAVERSPSSCGVASKTLVVPEHAPEGTVYADREVQTAAAAALRQSADSAPAVADLEGVTGSSGLSSDVTGGIGGLIASKGTTTGSGGLGARGSGLGGGGTAEGLSGLGAKGVGSGAAGYGSGGGDFGRKGEGAIGRVGGDPIVLGALDRSLIDEVIKRHLNAIRYCYQRELTKDPQLEGKVVVKIVIAGDGTVSSASVKSSSLGNEAVESCIVSRFERLQFPAPRGGGIVIVSYPFVFEPR